MSSVGGTTPECVGPPTGRPAAAKVGRSCPGVGVGQHWALPVSSLADEDSSGPCLMTLEKLLPLLSVQGSGTKGVCDTGARFCH